MPAVPSNVHAVRVTRIVRLGCNTCASAALLGLGKILFSIPSQSAGRHHSIYLRAATRSRSDSSVRRLQIGCKDHRARLRIPLWTKAHGEGVVPTGKSPHADAADFRTRPLPFFHCGQGVSWLLFIRRCGAAPEAAKSSARPVTDSTYHSTVARNHCPSDRESSLLGLGLGLVSSMLFLA